MSRLNELKEPQTEVNTFVESYAINMTSTIHDTAGTQQHKRRNLKKKKNDIFVLFLWPRSYVVMLLVLASQVRPGNL